MENKIHNIQVDDIFEKLKTSLGAKTDKELAANFLKINSGSIAYYKSKNSIPYEYIINLCIQKNISLDEIFGIDKIKKSNSIPIIDSSELICLQDWTQQNKDFSLKALIIRKTIYIIDTSIKNYIYDAKYLIENNKMYFAKFIEATIEQIYVLYGDTKEKENSYSKREFEKLNIAGMIVKELNISEVNYPSL